MISTDIKNPLTAGKVVSMNTDPAVYQRAVGTRGKADFVMSRSELTEFARCPHRWLAGVESEDTKSTEWGGLMDCRLLTPGAFKDRFAIKPATYPESKTRESKPWNGNSNWCKAWLEEHADKTVVSQENMTESDAALQALAADDKIMALINCSAKQVYITAEYHDEQTGIVVPVKTLIDLVPDRHSEYGKSLADFKTTRNAGLRGWTRDCFERRYHTQAAFYLDAYMSCDWDSERIEFLHVVQENIAPWETGRRLVSEEFIQLGRTSYLLALRRYCQCLKDNRWPGYDDAANNINGWTLVQPEAWMMI